MYLHKRLSSGGFGIPWVAALIEQSRSSIRSTLCGNYPSLSSRLLNDNVLIGPVFRVSPNELSFASVDSWKTIYGFPPPGQPHLIKGEFYDIYGAGFKTGCIGSERDPQQHALKKKNLLAAFSTKALNAQEALVQQCWDRFVEKVGPLSRETPGGIDIVKWFEMATFDILGEMAFGESFYCVENGEKSEIKQHMTVLLSKGLQENTTSGLI